MTPLVDVGLQFKAPARYDDTLRIEATIVEWQERRFRIAYRIFPVKRSSRRVMRFGHGQP